MLRMLAGFLALALILAGCTHKSGGGEPTKLPATPDEAIQRFVQAVNAGDYSTVADLMKNGPEMWQSEPALFKTNLEMVTHARLIQEYKPVNGNVNGEVATYSGWIVWSATEKRLVRFDLAMQAGGWLIIQLT